MRIAIATFAVMTGLALPAHAQACPEQRLPHVRSVPVESGPETVGSLGNTNTRTLAELNAISLERQVAFDRRLTERGQRALASLCTGCSVTSSSSFHRAGPVTASVLNARLPDAETIYSVKHGFDPAQAPVD